MQTIAGQYWAAGAPTASANTDIPVQVDSKGRLLVVRGGAGWRRHYLRCPNGSSRHRRPNLYHPRCRGRQPGRHHDLEPHRQRPDERRPWRAEPQF